MAHQQSSIATRGLSSPAMPSPRYWRTITWPSAWRVGAAARTTSLSSGSGGPSSTSTFTCMHSTPARLCGRALAGGSIITITDGAIRPLTTEPRMRFTTVCPILSPRLPDAFLSFQKLSAHSLFYPSGCPADGVHLPTPRIGFFFPQCKRWCKVLSL